MSVQPRILIRQNDIITTSLNLTVTVHRTYDSSQT